MQFTIQLPFFQITNKTREWQHILQYMQLCLHFRSKTVGDIWTTSNVYVCALFSKTIKPCHILFIVEIYIYLNFNNKYYDTALLFLKTVHKRLHCWWSIFERKCKQSYMYCQMCCHSRVLLVIFKNGNCMNNIYSLHYTYSQISCHKLNDVIVTA